MPHPFLLQCYKILSLRTGTERFKPRFYTLSYTSSFTADSLYLFIIDFGRQAVKENNSKQSVTYSNCRFLLLLAPAKNNPRHMCFSHTSEGFLWGVLFFL